MPDDDRGYAKLTVYFYNTTVGEVEEAAEKVADLIAPSSLGDEFVPAIIVAERWERPKNNVRFLKKLSKRGWLVVIPQGR